MFYTDLARLDLVLYTYYKDSMVSDDETYDDFLEAWILLKLSDMNKLYEAMNLTYNPLENYNMTEFMANRHSEGKRQTGTDTKARPRISQHFTTTQDSATAGRLEGYDLSGLNNGGTPDTDGLTTDAVKTSTEFANDATLIDGTTTPSTSYSANVVDLHDGRRSGNVGVTTSQMMLSSEIELRKKSFINYFCEMFADECLCGVYDGGYDL